MNECTSHFNTTEQKLILQLSKGLSKNSIESYFPNKNKVAKMKIQTKHCKRKEVKCNSIAALCTRVNQFGLVVNLSRTKHLVFNSAIKKGKTKSVSK